MESDNNNDVDLQQTIEMTSNGKSCDFNPGNLEIGKIVGNYEIIDRIAHGGSATVYLAEHVELSRTVALKIISPHLARNDEFVEMFTREAKASAQLDHPNIVQTYDAGTIDEAPYIAMEFIEGGNLKDYMNVSSEEKISLPKLLSIMRDIADALRYGQETLQLTHGDIKPENILIAFDGTPHLADFGLSETIASKKKDQNNDTTIMATPIYVAPEIIARRALPGDPRPDIYSFGCMLFHLITGEPPFKDSDVLALVTSHMRAQAPSLVSLVPEICKNLSDLVDEMLKKVPNDRPSSWKEVRDRLTDIIDEVNSPKLHIVKRHISLVFSFSKTQLQILLLACAALLIYFHPLLGPFIVILTLLGNYLAKSIHEPQNWLGIFKE